MSNLFKKLLGSSGEAKAIKYLKQMKYNIICQNFTSKFGEIDIVVENNEYLVFVEVKTRSSVAFGEGVVAVDRRKINKIIKTAEYYISQNVCDKLIRFDIISIDEGRINHIENAFTLE